jgi:YidC/Oxa1 family membrane protein insertase
MYQILFYQPILNLVIFLYNIIPGHDLGIAIILLTIIIKLLLYPLSKQSLKSQKSLQELQPKIEEIKRQHKDDKEKMSKAMMDLYKTNKVNPFSSCLPLLIQLPFLIAVFRVFRNGFGGTQLDLLYPFIHRPDAINYISFGFLNLANKNYVIAVLAGVAQYWQTKMMVTKQPPIKSTGAKDENMLAIMNKQMTYMMPIFTIFIAWSFPAGLGLYWLVTTILTGLQQMILFKKNKPLKIENLENKEGKKVIEGEIIEK